MLYPLFSSFLPTSIESLILDDIVNGQPAVNLDFNVVIYQNFKNISLQRNNLCGPFPNSWKNLKYNLTGHAKTLWCESSMNEACGKLTLFLTIF